LSVGLRVRHSFPTRRSSDLERREGGELPAVRRLQFQNHDGDDDGDDTVAERLEPALAHDPNSLTTGVECATTSRNAFWTPRFFRGSFSEHHHTPRFTRNPGGSMHHWRTLLAALIVVACGDQMPPSAVGGSASMLANAQSELVPAVVFNTQMRSALEVPACASATKGHAQAKAT